MKAQARAWWQQGTQLAQQGQQLVALFDQLVNQLADPDMHVLIPSIMALQQAGPLAIPALITGLTHHHTKVRRNCVDIIDHGGYGADGRCVEALLPLLHDRIPHIRRAVWHTLFCERCQDESKCEVMPSEPLDQVALLIEIGLHDPNPKLRGQLIEDLRKLQADPRAERTLGELNDYQRSP